MLHSVRDLREYAIDATDGRIGRVDDMLFDDEKWVVRYIVVDTGRWLPGRKVLISPISVESIDLAGKGVALHLDRERIRNSPDIYSDEPVSRQKEAAFYAHYDYGPYWAGLGVWGAAVYPRELRPLPRQSAWPAPDEAGEPAQSGSHLRSTRELIGYHIAASDGEIGHLDDFVVDGESWAVRHLIVDTSNWPGGRAVLMSPSSVRSIEWSASKIHTDAPVERIRNSTEYRAAELLR